MRIRFSVLVGLMAASLVCFSGCTTAPTTAEIAFADVALKSHSALTAQTQKAKWAQSWWIPRHNELLFR